MSTVFFGGSIFGGGFFAPTVIQVIDTHDGADKRYPKRIKERSELREMISRLIDGPTLPELVEEAQEALPMPLEADALTEWVSEVKARADERRRYEEEEEEIIAMVLH